MITFTDAGDTPNSIAHKVLGRLDESYADKIREANKTSFAYMLMNYSGFYSGNRAIWLPELSRYDDNPLHCRRLISEFDFMPSYVRANLVQLQKQGLDINYLAGIAKCTLGYNKHHREDGMKILGAFAAQTGVESANRFMERIANTSKRFYGHMHELNQALADLVDARRAGEAEKLQALRTRLNKVRRHVCRELHAEAELYTKRLSLMTQQALHSSRRLERLAFKKGIMVTELADVRLIEYIGRGCKYLTRGTYVASLLTGAYDVYKEYKNGEDWQADLFGIGVGLGFAALVGAGLALMLTPVGLVTIICTSVVEGGFIAATNMAMRELGTNGYKKLEPLLAQWT